MQQSSRIRFSYALALLTVIAALAGPGARRTSAAAGPANILTQRNDLGRTGATLVETVLTPAAVASGRFGLLYSLPVDGQVYAQPLYVSGITVQGRTRNVLYVATAHNSVYAFDADDPSGAPLWSLNLGPAVPQDPDNDPGGAAIPDCFNMTPEIGITSTPVIDPVTETMYVVAKSRDGGGQYHQRIYALGIRDGAIRGSSGIGAMVVTDGTTVNFDPRLNLNRPGLLLVNGTVYAAFGSHCDIGNYHGWVFGFDAATLQSRGVFVSTPTGTQGAIWQSQHALAADSSGRVYFVTGNGTFTPDGVNLSNAIVRLEQRSGSLVAADFFSPYNTEDLSAQDADLGSGGPVLIPGTGLLLAGGKEGRLYLADRSNLGRFDPAEDHVVQSFQASDVRFSNNIHGTPLYWNSPAGPRLYMWAENEPLKAFAFNGSWIDETPVGRSTVLAPWDAMPGGALSLSANGSTPGTGIVWAAIAQLWDASNTVVDGVLRAFDAEDVSFELWNSDRDSADALGKFAKFAPPTVANGKVFVATFSGAVRVYGLRSDTPPGTASPYGGTAAVVPGMIQAENFDEGGNGIGYRDGSSGNAGGAYRNTDVDIEATSDSGGGSNVGWMAAGEWLQYTISVATGGSYALEARVASEGSGGTFHVEVNGMNKTGPLTIPDTGGWQSWATLTRGGLVLDPGQQTLRIVLDSDGPNNAVGNINWIRLTATSSSGGSLPFGGTPATVPGTIQAENFDEGGEGVAYHDSGSGNAGGEYRNTGVDIEPTADSGGGVDVGWMAPGEWLQYTVNVAASAAYTLVARVASEGPGGTFHIEVDGQDRTGSLTIPDTGGWQSWRDVTRSGISLSAGRHVLRLVLDSDAGDGSVGNVNYLRFTTASGGSTPFGGVPVALPGLIQAENFDDGGEGVAYHDAMAGNDGGEYRDTDVDIQSSADSGGGFNVGWIYPGEWLQYTVSVAASGTYALDVRVASPGPGGTFHVEANGTNVTGTMTVPDTGDWQSWQTITRSVVLQAGQQRLRLVIDDESPVSGLVGNVKYLRVR